MIKIKLMKKTQINFKQINKIILINIINNPNNMTTTTITIQHRTNIVHASIVNIIVIEIIKSNINKTIKIFK